jgi:hypothetical protein
MVYLLKRHSPLNNLSQIVILSVLFAIDKFIVQAQMTGKRSPGNGTYILMASLITLWAVFIN